MSNKVSFRVTICDGKKELYSADMSFNEVQDYISAADDDVLNQKLFELAACHSSELVRENVAYKDNIDEKTWNNLSEDTSINVLRRLVTTDATRAYASQEKLENWIKLDAELARSIANHIDRYQNADVDDLAIALSNHSDPSVLAELAGNSDTPKKLLKILLKHPDTRVSLNAKRALD